MRLRDYSPEIIETQVRAAVGIRLGITRLEGAFKLSQNKGAADRDGEVSGLRQAGNTGLAEAMDGMFKHRGGGE